MFKIDTNDIKELESELKAFANKAYPFATRKTLNDAAFQAQKIARNDIRENMINRNRFTVQSIRVEQTRTLQVSSQASVVGSIADYMEDQEFGSVKSKGGKNGVAIPTSYSAGQNENSRVRTRLPRKANTMANINLTRRRKRSKTRRQRNLLAVQDAVATGRRFIFMDLGRTQGIFKVVGGQKSFKRGWPKGAKLKMIYDLTRQSVVIPKNPWLKPAVDETQRMIPAFYADALRFQLKRHNILR